jgi:hypothetical protein
VVSRATQRCAQWLRHFYARNFIAGGGTPSNPDNIVGLSDFPGKVIPWESNGFVGGNPRTKGLVPSVRAYGSVKAGARNVRGGGTIAGGTSYVSGSENYAGAAGI